MFDSACTNDTRADLGNKTVLITGAAGFIGASLAVRLLEEAKGCTIIGVDNLNDYYDPSLKLARLRRIADAATSSLSTWEFSKMSITSKDDLLSLFSRCRPQIVVHLAAQAGVRHSIDHPDAYIENNIIGFFNVIEACRHHPVEHLVYASSSSVYGNSEKIPFSVDDKTDSPVSLYAATKKSNELLAYAYSSMFKIPITGLRFFTVYGPYGRPDMFAYSAAEKIMDGKVIHLYNKGRCKRDFTYIDDAVEGIVCVMTHHLPHGDVPHSVYNVGGGHPEYVLDFVDVLQEELAKAGALPPDYDGDAHRVLDDMQLGDVLLTYADGSPLERDYGFVPQVGIQEGLGHFVEWLISYRGTATQ